MRKEIFIASSRESLSLVREIAVWVEEAQCKALCWDDPELFLPGDNTFLKLQEISKAVDGAILIFSEDDKIWYRGDSSMQPRDNLLIEYGLFAGNLGQHKAAICTSGDIKKATDLAGITVANLDPHHKQYSRRKMLAWLNRIDNGKVDPISIKLAVSRRQLNEKEEELNFLRTANSDLLSRISKDDSLVQDQWKSLFTYGYVFDIEIIISKYMENISIWNNFLENPNLLKIANYIDDPQPNNNSRMPFIIRKVLRVIRRYYSSNELTDFLSLLPQGAQEEINMLTTWG